MLTVAAADDMENGVLRGNRPAASNLWAILGLPQFSKGQFPDPNDPRRKKVRFHPLLCLPDESCDGAPWLYDGLPFTAHSRGMLLAALVWPAPFPTSPSRVLC